MGRIYPGQMSDVPDTDPVVRFRLSTDFHEKYLLYKLLCTCTASSTFLHLHLFPSVNIPKRQAFYSQEKASCTLVVLYMHVENHSKCCE